MVQHEVQARPEHERLSCNHAGPADSHYGDLEEVVGEGETEHFEEIAEAEGDDGDGRDQEGPEVGAGVAFEGVEAEDNQLDGIAPGEGDEDGEDIFFDGGVEVSG